MISLPPITQFFCLFLRIVALLSITSPALTDLPTTATDPKTWYRSLLLTFSLSAVNMIIGLDVLWQSKHNRLIFFSKNFGCFKTSTVGVILLFIIITMTHCRHFTFTSFSILADCLFCMKRRLLVVSGVLLETLVCLSDVSFHQLDWVLRQTCSHDEESEDNKCKRNFKAKSVSQVPVGAV